MRKIQGVFANGIWKSGNNLLVRVVEQLGCPLKTTGIASSLVLGKGLFARKWIRGPGIFEYAPIQVGIDIPVNISSRWMRALLTKGQDGLVPGHAAYSDQLLNMLKENNFKVIQIVRDPRDIVVSFAHWIKTRPDYYAYPFFADVSHEEIMLRLIKGGRCGGLYYDSLATVLDRSYGWITASKEDVLVVHFENLVGLKGGGDATAQMKEISRIADWIHSPCTDLMAVAERSFGHSRSGTMRKGHSGEWRNEFTDKVDSVFKEVVGERLRHWGYE